MGPNTFPWGIPRVILMLLDNKLFIFTTSVLLNKTDSQYQLVPPDWSHPMRLPAKPLAFNLISSLLYESESKAFLKSMWLV